MTEEVQPSLIAKKDPFGPSIVIPPGRTNHDEVMSPNKIMAMKIREQYWIELVKATLEEGLENSYNTNLSHNNPSPSPSPSSTSNKSLNEDVNEENNLQQSASPQPSPQSVEVDDDEDLDDEMVSLYKDDRNETRENKISQSIQEKQAGTGGTKNLAQTSLTANGAQGQRFDRPGAKSTGVSREKDARLGAISPTSSSPKPEKRETLERIRKAMQRYSEEYSQNNNDNVNAQSQTTAPTPFNIKRQ